MYDWNKVYVLMEVLSKSGGYPALGNIHQAALKELQAMNDQDVPDRKRPRDITPAAGPANALTQMPSGEVRQKPAVQIPPNPNQQPPIETIRRDAAGNIIPDPVLNRPVLDRPTSLINDPDPDTMVDRRV